MKKTDKKQGTKWSGLLVVAMMAMGMAAAQAQTPAPTVFGIGTGMADPQGTLHVHSSETTEPLFPILPPDDPGLRGDEGGSRDGQYDPDHYQTLLHMTNSATGTTLHDGFTLKQYDDQLTFIQHEQSSMRFETPGGGFVLDKHGNMGIGGCVQGYRLNVDGSFRVASHAQIEQSLVLGTSLLVGTSLTVGLNVSVYGGLAVGNGFECDNQGNLKVKRLRVTLTDWPDYVFGEGYRLPSLGEVERYVREHSHLPGVPSAEEVERDGADLGEINKVLLQKVEELTLYIIDLQKQLNELKSNR